MPRGIPSEWKLQMVHVKTGEVAWSWIPGMGVEVETVENLVDRAVAKGVGLGRTSKHVAADIRAAFHEMLFDLKNQV